MKRFAGRIAPILFVALASIGIYACSDSTGPDGGGGRTASITVQPAFQSAAAGVVSFTRAHIIVHRADGSVALDTTVDYTGSPAGLHFDVPLSRLSGVDGETLTVEFDLLNAAGAVVFHGGPVSVAADPDTPATTSATTVYIGTGASATRVEIAPTSANALTGANVDFTAKAFGADNVEIPGTPVQFSSVTPSLATVPNPAVGRAVMGTSRGTARIRAMLITGQTADATVNITAPASALSIQSGNNQNLPVNSAAQPLVVKVTAADGLGVGGVSVAFAIQSGGGTLGATQVSTDANGVASVGYTFGQTPGTVSIQASVAGLSGSPATFTLTGTSSAVSQLVFVNQPTNAIVGASIGTVTVEARDQFNNKVTGFNGPVTVTLESPPAGVSLQGNNSAIAVNGVATFQGLSVSAAATGLRLTATVTGVGSVTSSAFNVTLPPATALVFTTLPPSGTPAGNLFTIVVQARDANNLLATGYTGTVTISIDGPAALVSGSVPPPGITLMGTTSVQAVGGIATFPGLSLNAPVSAIRFIATGTGIQGSTSSGVITIGDPVNPLVSNPTATNFTVQRSAASPAPVTVALTGTGITGLAIGSITYGPGATGWLAAGLSSTTVPSTLTLTPTTGALPEGRFTASVNITGAAGVSLSYPVAVTVTPLPVTQLVMITQPAGAASGVNFATAPVVELRDATNTRVLSATNTVTASVASGTGTLAGTTAVAAVQGRATFSDLRINGTGAHTLAFTIAGPISVTSASFNVAAALSTTQAVASVNGTSGIALTPVTPVTAAGGVLPYTFALTGATLPAGLSFNTSTGQLTGTASSASGPFTFTVTVTDATNTTSSKTFTLTIAGALSTTQVIATRSGDVGTALASFTPVTASGGTAPITFAISPAATLTGVGLAFNTATGAITGTPTGTLATTTFTVTATDNLGATSSKTFDLTINAALTTTQAVATITATQGAAVASTVPVTAAGGTNPITFAISPAGTFSGTGLSFNTATGAITGTPATVLAATTFTVTATDNIGTTSSKTFQLTVNSALTTTQAVPVTTGTQGSPLSFTPVTAGGGTAPITFAVSTPAALTGIGLTFNATNGLLSGTPTGALSTTVFTVSATDAAGATSAKTFQLTINGALTTTQVIAAKVGTVGANIASFVPVTAAGGTAPYTFALTGGSLPAGLSFNTSTGAVSGLPTAALATTTFTVTVTDNVGATSSKTFDLTVNAALTTTQAVASTTGTVNVAIPAFTPVTAANGTTPYTFALTGGTLPAGMSFNTTTGQITGTPTVTLGTTTFTVTATDAAGATSSKTFQLTVNGALTTTQAVPTRTGTINTAIATFTPVTASGGTTPYSFALTGGTLPTGMSFNTTNGQVSGTPTATLATTTFTVTVTDNVGATSSKTFQLTVNGALTTTQAVPSTTGTANTLLPSFTPVTAAGGTTPYTFALSGGTLPTGLSFNTSTGQISGTPTAAQSLTTYTVTATDAAGATSSKTFTLVVNGPFSTTQAIPSRVGTVNTAIPNFIPVTAGGGTLPYTFALSGGTLPTGMSFNTATGEVSGTPTTTLTATTFTVTVTDNAAATSSKTFQLTVNGALTTTQAVASRSGTVNTAITAFTPVTAAGGTTPYAFALTGGTLPTGMSFNTSTGQISGTPTSTLATTTFTVTVTDAAAATSSKTFDLTVNGALTTTQAVASRTGTVNNAITAFTPVTAAGGTIPYTFGLSGGLLPTGMSFNTSTGQVSGTPTTTLATTTFTVTVTDNAGATSSKTFDLTVNGALNTTQAVASRVGTVNTAIAAFTPVTASGGTTPYAFALSGGTLPTGMSFNTANGQITGTPTTTLGATTFTVTVTDNVGATSSKTFQLTVNGALTTTQAVATTTGTANSALASFTPVTASGGTTPYTFALTPVGTLPAGLSFNTATGQISGTPTSSLSTTTFTVTVTDNAGATSSKTFDLTVNGPFSTTQAIASRVGTVNTLIPTFTPVTAGGGTLPYTFALTGGTLPTGMSFNTTNGQVSGTPTTTLAATTFTVTVTDNAAASSSKTFQLTVNGALTTTQAVASRVGTVNTAIASFTPVTASGGTAPYTFALTGGTLPTGMSFNTGTGQITGTPTSTLGLTTFTVTATDNAGATSSKTFDLTVNSALTTTQAVAATVGTQGTLIPTFTPVTAAGGTTPYTFALSGGVLPTGMSFNTTNGQVSGTPATSLATTSFTVTVTDNAGATSSKTFQLTVNSALTTTQAVASRTGTVGTLIPTFTPVTASGGSTPYTFALTGGTLPTGMSFNTSNGQVSGTPTSTLTVTTFTVTVTDNAGATSSKTFQLTVNAAVSTTQAVASVVGTQNTLIPSFTPVTATGGTSPLTFALTGGTLPTGISFNTSTGQISGTPLTTLALTTFTVTATDNVGSASSKTFDLTVNTALTTTQAVASKVGTQNTLIATFTPVTAAGGTAPLTFALTGGTLPTGMSFNTANGQVSGTPSTTLSLTTFTVTVTDAANATSSKTFQLTVNGALTTTQAVATKVGTQNTLIPTFTPVTAAGGTAPITFALTGGTLPTGMSFNTSNGQVSGTPTTTLATTTFTVTATDAAGATSSKTFDLTVNTALTTTQAVAATVGTQNTLIPTFTPVTAAGGTVPLTFALTGGTLPTGMSFNTTNGQVSGTPSTTLGLTTFTVTVTDVAGATSSKTFQLTVNTALTTTQAVATKVGTQNTAIPAFTPVTAAGGTAPLAFALTGGTLPTGMSFNTTNGQITGTPTSTLAATTFTVTVTDAANATSSKTFQLTVNTALTTTQAVAAKVGTQNTLIPTFTPVTAAGGTAPLAFAPTGGALPTGMSFNTTNGQISGTPSTTLTTTTFTVTVTDAVGATSSKTFQLTVNAALTTTQAIPTTTGSQNSPMSFTPVTAANGTTPYAFALTGTLPTGLNFNTTNGLISGTPTASLATTTFTVTVTDNAGATSSKTFQLTVNGALSATQAVASITTQAGTAITTQVPITAGGGTAPYTFAISGGTLPTGMTFNTTNGQLSGTPTTMLATTAFTVTITDNVGATASNSFNLTVNAIQLLVNATSPATFTQNVDVAIPINIDMTQRGTDNLAALQVTINFDPTRFAFVGEAFGNGGALGWSEINNFNNAVNGTIVLSGFAATGITSGFTLHTITLKPLTTGAGAVVTATVNNAATDNGGSTPPITLVVRNLTAAINP